MQLHDLAHISPATGLRCRTSHWHSVVGGLTISAILTAVPFIWWKLGAPTVVWGMTAALAVCVVPPILGTVGAAFRPSNWLLFIEPAGLWIHLRSYTNARRGDAQTVLFLPYREIQSASAHDTNYSVPGRGNTTTEYYRQQSLDLKVRPDLIPDIRVALTTQRKEAAVERNYFGITVRSHFKHHPVTILPDGTLRIAWRGQHDCVTPKLQTVLRQLAGHIPIDDPVIRQRADWDQLSDDEVDTLVLELVTAGQSLDAIKLLVRRREYTTTEAKQFVDELSRQY